MAVDDPEVIDFVGTTLDQRAVVLTVSDHLDWASSDEHLLVLQEKINRYLAFIESAELVEQYPDAAGRAVRIEVVLRCEPSREGAAFLRRAQGVIEAAGIEFGWHVLDPA